MESYSMKKSLKILAIITALASALASKAQDISPGYTFTDGQRLTAAQLESLVNQAAIQPAFYTDKIIQTNLNPTDILLVYNPSSGTYHQLTGQTAVFGNTAFITGQPEYPTNTLAPYDYLLIYDPTNGILAKVSVTNEIQFLSAYVVAPHLSFANTNNAGATNQYALPVWPYHFSGFQTNNQPQLLTWDTNGVPYQESLSNAEKGIAADLGTNLSLPYVFNQLFLPWTVYGTNLDYPYTNAWGYPTNFPITSLFIGTNTTPTLTDTDTVPVLANDESTNVPATMTLDSLYEYMTNKNALPPYTVARIQFSGLHAAFTLSNQLFNTSAGLLFATNNPFMASAPTAVSFNLSGLTAPFTTPILQSNTLYYAVATATNQNWFHLYTNYLQAFYQTNNLPVTGTPSGTSVALVVTNFTSFNADVIQEVTPADVVNTGVYDVYFRTPAANSFYYLTGSTQFFDNGLVFYPFGVITTNYFRIGTYEGRDNIFAEDPLVQVLVNPQ